MPPGPARDRIEAVARRLHFRYADLLEWPTHGSVTNAMIVGLLPRVRYVIFTDGILEEMPPDELDAVFGHEAGHALHGHIWFYALFLILSAALVGGAFLLAGQSHDALMWVAFAAYFFVVFGFLSRRCERQADIFGCRAVSCADPNCTGHDAATVYPERGSGLCPTGIRTCARALERVSAVAGHGGPDGDGRWSVGMLLRGVFGWLRAWQHSTLPRRVKFLLSLIDDRDRERRFQRRVWLFRWALAVGMGLAVVALGQTLGWGKLLEVM
jgi:Zn-dependent protease with chaperone function